MFKEEGIKLDARLITLETRNEIAVPYLSEFLLICPAFAIKTLWDRVQQANPNTNSLLLNTNTFAPFKAGGNRRIAEEALLNAGKPETYSPFSIMAASISALTMAGFPPAQITNADLASLMGKVIAISGEGLTKQAQHAEEEEKRGKEVCNCEKAV
ncbi:uncharacterized protein MONOS_12409 [Monocercomonoides exilis]|uniref:uncharacterized protein n=1 Tax=Monocercomonoides exilis TaxID=2049356 RepID=UPI00355A8A80|nr:hypothetical protein MONOS_12409 [Monocercomonoides exilis]|eukprot:MONOS_12409.1-p1 / transcript=MONOS_12409.1 / gene=MONOS_12409 / organism=Monocercomonoides_exilis_PA203 / gene_product=unspecified product / transcript_product=unspecified product / location=Mono_scaffold00686:2282-2749(-) / protein_length=156 / sequence_SO=supercontig / SO=protein_coding / is_pseudo=false